MVGFEMKNFLKNIFYTSSNSEQKQIIYLKNSFSYLKLLKENDEKEIPKYKLELGAILNEMDIFLLKTRIIFSFLGLVGSGIIVLIALNNYIISSYDSYGLLRQITVVIFYIYISVFIFYMSYVSLRRALSDLKKLKKMIE